MYTHFCFLNLWFWEKKVSRIFLVSMEYRKSKSFQKVLKKCHTGELHKKGTILHHTFFYSPCMYLDSPRFYEKIIRNWKYETIPWRFWLSTIQTYSFYFTRSFNGCSRLHFILQDQLLDAVVFILFYKISYWMQSSSFYFTKSFIGQTLNSNLRVCEVGKTSLPRLIKSMIKGGWHL